MSANGWLQFAIYSLDSACNRSSGGHLSGPRAGGRAHLARSGASPVRAAHLQALRRERRPGDELARVRLCHAGLFGRQHGADLRHRALADIAALEPAGAGRRRARPGLEHRGQLYHQYQLAVVYARDHHELSHRDGRSGDSQLLVGGGGHRGGRGADSRHQADHFRHHRQLLGRHDAHPALHPAAGFVDLCAAAGWPGRSAEPARVYRRASAGTALPDADHRAGSGSFAGSHQDAGHQRRRILQRQQRPSV